MDKINLALEYAQKAIKENSENGFAYSTLAENYAKTGDNENFYKYTEKALENGYPAWEVMDVPPYDRYASQERFRKLIKKYRR